MNLRCLFRGHEWLRYPKWDGKKGEWIYPPSEPFISIQQSGDKPVRVVVELCTRCAVIKGRRL